MRLSKPHNTLQKEETINSFHTSQKPRYYYPTFRKIDSKDKDKPTREIGM